MGLFGWLFGGATELPSAYDPTGVVALVVRSTERELSEALRRAGCSAVVFDPAAADLIDQIAGAKPSAIAIEVDARAADGFRLHRSLKRDPRTRAIPDLLFSATGDEGTFAQHSKLKARAHAYESSAEPQVVVRAIEGLRAKRS